MNPKPKRKPKPARKPRAKPVPAVIVPVHELTVIEEFHKVSRESAAKSGRLYRSIKRWFRK